MTISPERRAQMRAACRRYYLKNKDKVNARSRARSRIYKPKQHTRAYARAYHLKRRTEILTFLGGKCKHCGFDDPRVLQIDHVNGGGSKEYRTQPSMSTLYNKVEATPELYQLLCANCNWIKRYENNEIKRID